MSAAAMSAFASPASLPPLYRRIVTFDPVAHADLRVARGWEYRCVAKADFLPLGLPEPEHAANAFGKAVTEQGVRADEEISATFDNGASTRVRGFQVIRPDRLDNIADKVFLN